MSQRYFHLVFLLLTQNFIKIKNLTRNDKEEFDAAERAVAHHRLHTGLPDLQQKSDGQVCQLSLHHFIVVPVGHTGDGLERGVIGQPVLTLCSYCE